MQEIQVQSLGQEDPLEEEMATRSSIIAWRITMDAEEPGGLQSIGLHPVPGRPASPRMSQGWGVVTNSSCLPPPIFLLPDVCPLEPGCLRAHSG